MLNPVSLSSSSSSVSCSPSSDEPVEIALSFLRQSLPGFDFEVTDNYVTKKNGVTHVYGRQIVKGRTVANAFFNVNVDKSGRVVNMAESFYKGTLAVPTEPKIDPVAALLSLAKTLNIPLAKKIQLVKFFGKAVSLFSFFFFSFLFSPRSTLSLFSFSSLLFSLSLTPSSREEGGYLHRR